MGNETDQLQIQRPVEEIKLEKEGQQELTGQRTLMQTPEELQGIEQKDKKQDVMDQAKKSKFGEFLRTTKEPSRTNIVSAFDELKKGMQYKALTDSDLSKREEKAREKMGYMQIISESDNLHYEGPATEEYLQGLREGKLDQYTSDIMEVDLDKYNFKNDKEFANNYHKDMEDLTAAHNLQMALDAMIMDQKSGVTMDMVGKLYAKLEEMEKIREEYEERKKLMQSPYYVLISKEDTDHMSDEDIKDRIRSLQDSDGDPNLVEYLKRVERLRHGRTAGL